MQFGKRCSRRPKFLDWRQAFLWVCNFREMGKMLSFHISDIHLTINPSQDQSVGHAAMWKDPKSREVCQIEDITEKPPA